MKFNRLTALVAALAIAAVSCISANTDVFLVNKTNVNLAVSYEAPKGTGFKSFATSLAPNQKAKIMTFSRGADLEMGKTYYFTATASFPDQSWVKLKQKVVGRYIPSWPVKNSDIWAAIQTPNTSTQWFTDKNVTQTFADKWSVGGNTYAASFQWVSGGDILHKDIVFEISATGQVTAANTLNLLQYNIQERPAIEGLQYQTTGTHSERSRLSSVTLPDVIKSYNADVVTFNEAFTAALRPVLVENMRKNGYIYHTDVMSDSRPWSGGVMIFSKYPITRQAQYIYKNSGGADANSSKGIQYAQINKSGTMYNIFATHTNASYEFDPKTKRVPLDDKGRIARRKQFPEARAFINAQNIPANQAVIVVGDMNVDMLSERNTTQDEYAYMLTTLNATHPTQTGHKYTLDAATNKLVEKGETPQWLDYALYLNDHARPTTSENRAINLKSGGEGRGSDLSDHYPVFATFSF